MDDSQIIFLQRLIKYVFKDKLNNKELKKYMQELESKQKNGGDIMFVDIMVKKFEEVFEMEEKVKEQETKVKEQETKVKEQETKVKERETKVKKREAEIKEREKAVTIAENQMIIKMLKNNVDESTILKIVNIDKNRLAKIKQDNNFAVAN